MVSAAHSRACTVRWQNAQSSSARSGIRLPISYCSCSVNTSSSWVSRAADGRITRTTAGSGGAIGVPSVGSLIMANSPSGYRCPWPTLPLQPQLWPPRSAPTPVSART